MSDPVKRYTVYLISGEASMVEDAQGSCVLFRDHESDKAQAIAEGSSKHDL